MGNHPRSVKAVYVVLVISIFGALTIGALLVGEGPGIARVGGRYLDSSFEFPNVDNAVFGVYGMYRFYDTLFELLIFATAVLGITVFSDLEPSLKTGKGSLVESHVVSASASFLYPIIAVFGIYLAFSAHLGPGGGFAGGVISGTGILLLALARGAEEIGGKFRENSMKRVEYFVIFLALLVVILGSIFPGRVYRGLPGFGVITLVNISIGLKVFIGTWAILHFFVKHRGEV
ncbi:MAG: MnhB domain-containing protein [Candidatus Bipolaricaulia bacterium]